MQCAIRADASPADHASFGGRRAAQLASDSFLVWLELPPPALSLNLNPDEPDRIIHKQFGRTDAGRVLLETVVLPASRRYFRLTSPHRHLPTQPGPFLRGTSTGLRDSHHGLPPRPWRARTRATYVTRDPMDIR